jgi:hypothetical protein
MLDWDLLAPLQAAVVEVLEFVQGQVCFVQQAGRPRLVQLNFDLQLLESVQRFVVAVIVLLLIYLC